MNSVNKMSSLTPVERAWRTIDFLRAHPQAHLQPEWLMEPKDAECGTVGCFAGWTSLLAGYQPVMELRSGAPAGSVATEVVDPDLDGEIVHINDLVPSMLGLSFDQAARIFYSDNTMTDIEDAVTRELGPRPAPGEWETVPLADVKPYEGPLVHSDWDDRWHAADAVPAPRPVDWKNPW